MFQDSASNDKSLGPTFVKALYWSASFVGKKCHMFSKVRDKILITPVCHFVFNRKGKRCVDCSLVVYDLEAWDILIH